MRDSVHCLANVHPGAHLGHDVRVEAFATIHHGARIGPGTHVKEYAMIGAGAGIGADCSIGAYTEIRAKCVIGVRVRFGSMCLVADGTLIGNDSHLSGRFTTCNKPEPKQHRPCAIGPRFYAGVGVTIMPSVAINEDVVVGASSTVRHHIPSGETWFGNPAVKHR